MLLSKATYNWGISLFVNDTPLDKIYDLSAQMSIWLKAAPVGRHDTSKPTVHYNIWQLATLYRPTSSFCGKKSVNYFVMITEK